MPKDVINILDFDKDESFILNMIQLYLQGLPRAKQYSLLTQETERIKITCPDSTTDFTTVTAFSFSIYKGYGYIVDYLLKFEPNFKQFLAGSSIFDEGQLQIESLNVEKIPALNIAISSNKPEILRKLLDARSFTEQQLTTALAHAINEEWSLECIKVLLEYGADINYRNPRTGMTTFLLAMQRGDIELMKDCILKGANIEQVTRGLYNSNTPLVYAVWFNYHHTIINLLIEAGAEVNHENFTNTALYAAVKLKNVSLTQQLLQVGAQTNRILSDNYKIISHNNKDDKEFLENVKKDPAANPNMEKIRENTLNGLYQHCFFRGKHALPRVTEALSVSERPELSTSRISTLITTYAYDCEDPSTINSSGKQWFVTDLCGAVIPVCRAYVGKNNGKMLKAEGVKRAENLLSILHNPKQSNDSKLNAIHTLCFTDGQGKELKNDITQAIQKFVGNRDPEIVLRAMIDKDVLTQEAENVLEEPDEPLLEEYRGTSMKNMPT